MTESNVDHVKVTVTDAFGQTANDTITLTVEKCNCSDPNSIISFPEPSQTVAGPLTIYGTALHDRFKFYKLEFSEHGANNPPKWEWPVDSTIYTQVDNRILGTWDTRNSRDGAYTLRLTVVDQDSQELPSCLVDIEVDNTSPTPVKDTGVDNTSPSDVKPNSSPIVSQEVTDGANLRDGPGSTFKLGGSVKVGSPLSITGRNEENTWYRLADGHWILASLVEGAPNDIPVVQDAEVKLNGPIVSREVTGGANLRDGPESTFNVIGKLLAGTRLTITGRNEENTWYRLADGYWISVSLVEGAPGDIAVVQATEVGLNSSSIVSREVTYGANLRDGPGSTFNVIGSLLGGAPLSITESNEANTWYRLASGYWIKASLVEGAPSGIPVVQAAADGLSSRSVAASV